MNNEVDANAVINNLLDQIKDMSLQLAVARAQIAQLQAPVAPQAPVA